MADYTNIKTTKKSEVSEVEITGEVPAEVLAKYRTQALKGLNNTLTIPGFRKGHIPEKVIVERVGEVYVLEEAAELALQEVVPEIVEKEAPDFVGRPKITITKLAPGNALEFKVTIDVLPDFKLPNYKKIGKESMSKEEKVEVSDKDVDAVVEEIRKQHAHHAYHKAHPEAGHNHNDDELETFKPEFTDEFVKTLGAFESVADFRTKALENIKKEKEHRALEKRRTVMLEKLVEDTKVSIPEALVESELSKMFAQFESDIAGIGLNMESYLKHIKKTPEDLSKEWRPEATKRAAVNLILGKIAKEEKLVADKDAVEHEVKHLKEHYPDADDLRVRAYVEHTLTIEKVIKFLEEQK